ncbi:MAG: GGDEF domain-containing protein [Desulfobacteraceae bacterium]|nr:GGDEF domain-containing protein [Desulfobacteraceae bacterium]MCB9494079.1 GGDEF domain-containing protein [Desulfobacteraceae bacterium]
MYDYSDSIIKRLKNNAVKDGVIILLLAAVIYCLCIRYDIFEILLFYVHKYEKYELDELIVILCILFISFAAYSSRRLADLRIAFSVIRKISQTDDLTGVSSRRRIFELIYGEFIRYKRYGRPFCLLLIDIDEFKKINDNYGHRAGDKVLKKVADLMGELSRRTDSIGRIGGDEFLVLLPETDMDEALKMAERLLKKSTSLYISDSGYDISFSLSIGATDIKENIESIEHLILIADRLLYKAKSQGKNRVTGDESISGLEKPDNDKDLCD